MKKLVDSTGNNFIVKSLKHDGTNNSAIVL
jgi:hypothetical protein